MDGQSIHTQWHEWLYSVSDTVDLAGQVLESLRVIELVHSTH